MIATENLYLHQKGIKTTSQLLSEQSFSTRLFEAAFILRIA